MNRQLLPPIPHGLDPYHEAIKEINVARQQNELNIQFNNLNQSMVQILESYVINSRNVLNWSLQVQDEISRCRIESLLNLNKFSGIVSYLMYHRYATANCRTSEEDDRTVHLYNEAQDVKLNLTSVKEGISRFEEEGKGLLNRINFLNNCLNQLENKLTKPVLPNNFTMIDLNNYYADFVTPASNLFNESFIKSTLLRDVLTRSKNALDDVILKCDIIKRICVELNLNFDY